MAPEGLRCKLIHASKKGWSVETGHRGEECCRVKICISRFLSKHNLTHHVITHKVQQDPSKVKVQALKFLEYIRPCMADGSCHPDYIINMDQTPVWHSMDSSRTIDRVGVRNVSMRTSTNDPLYAQFLICKN
jgi:hypothetical protein